IAAAIAAQNDLLLILFIPPKSTPPFQAGQLTVASFYRVPPGRHGAAAFRIGSIHSGVLRLNKAAYARASAKEALKKHGGDNDRADRRALPIRVDVQQIQTIADEHHDEHTH